MRLKINNFILKHPFFVEELDESSSLAKWSSLDLLNEEDLDNTSPVAAEDKNGMYIIIIILFTETPLHETVVLCNGRF